MNHKEALSIAVREVTVSPDANMEECLLDAIRAYIEARGLVMVPKEPTDEMFIDPDDVCVNFGESSWTAFKRLYSHLLAAAPDPFKDDNT